MSQAPPSTAEPPAEQTAAARRPIWPLYAAGLLLALAALGATLQAPYRDAYGHGERTWLNWLIHPLERNPELRLPRVAGDLTAIAFAADGETGFAVGGAGTILMTENGPAAGQGDAILATENGGLDWKLVRKTNSHLLNSIAVSADGKVAAAAGRGEILIMRGEKSIWRTANSPALAYADFSDVQVSDDGTRIEAISRDIVFSSANGLVRSVDSGATWSIVELPGRQVSEMVFDASGRNGWLGMSSGEIYSTTSGGITWVEASGTASSDAPKSGAAFNLPAQSPRAVPYSADFPSDAPLLLSVAFSVPPPDKSPEAGAPDDQQYPNAAVQGLPPASNGESNAPAGPAASGAIQNAPATQTRIVRPRPSGKTASGPGVRRAGTADGTSASPRPVPVPSQTPSAIAVKATETAERFFTNPIVALAAVPNSREVAGIRWIGATSELFIGRNGVVVNTSLYDFTMGDPDTGWATGQREIWGTNDGATWRKQFTTERNRVTAVAAARDGRRAWVVGTQGMLLATVDGGANWFHQLRKPGLQDPQGSYARFPAPWFYLALGLLGGFIAYARRPLPVEPQPGVSAIGASDAPAVSLAEDKLQFAPLARGISRYLRNANTRPPLTLAISGDWGCGKSSLMQMVCEDLRRHGNHPVWFNAWHHQDEEQLLAALLAAIRDKALPLWLSLDGLRFRTHLFLLRARRSLPKTLLLVGIAGFCLAFLIPGDRDAWTGLANWLAALLPGDGKTQSAELGGKVIQYVAGFAAFLTAFRGIFITLKAFGADPAVLLTSTIDNFKLRDASAQVHFRTRFQRQFDEVVTALPYPLVIVIDDLDRCRPDTVLQVMESVNFLMSSGECFVLFGMATHRVQAALAVSFKDIAGELVEIDSATPADASAPVRERAERDKRLKYAGEYLQKLINLEIRVPRREDIAPHLLLTRGPAAGEESEIAAARRWARLLWPLALAAAVAGGSWWAGADVLGSLATPAVAPIVQSAPGLVAANPASANDPITRASPTPPAVPDAVVVEPGIQSDAGPDWPIIVLLAALLGLVAALQYRRRKAEEIVVDTQPFIEALQVWTPIVARRNPSPRAIKRFGNRLRYFAMLQQAEEFEADDRWRWPDWLPLRVALIGARASPTVRTRVDVVAEHRIVALGAIHAVFGDRDWRNCVNSRPPKSNGADYSDVDTAIAAYTAGGWRWPPSGPELDAFERSLKGIRLGGDIAVIGSVGAPTDSPGPASSAAPGSQRQPKSSLRKEQM